MQTKTYQNFNYFFNDFWRHFLSISDPFWKEICIQKRIKNLIIFFIDFRWIFVEKWCRKGGQRDPKISPFRHNLGRRPPGSPQAPQDPPPGSQLEPKMEPKRTQHRFKTELK